MWEDAPLKEQTKDGDTVKSRNFKSRIRGRWCFLMPSVKCPLEAKCQKGNLILKMYNCSDCCFSMCPWSGFEIYILCIFLTFLWRITRNKRKPTFICHRCLWESLDCGEREQAAAHLKEWLTCLLLFVCVEISLREEYLYLWVYVWFLSILLCDCSSINMCALAGKCVCETSNAALTEQRSRF